MYFFLPKKVECPAKRRNYPHCSCPLSQGENIPSAVWSTVQELGHFTQAVRGWQRAQLPQAMRLYHPQWVVIPVWRAVLTSLSLSSGQELNGGPLVTVPFS